MEATDDMKFGDTEMQRFARLLNDFVDTELKAVRIAFFPGEGAELAAQDAVVGVIDVAIDDVARTVADFLLSREVGDGANDVQVFALEKAQGIGFGDALTCDNFVVDISQWAALNEKLHENRITEIARFSNDTKSEFEARRIRQKLRTRK
jgi:hypothetical protein